MKETEEKLDANFWNERYLKAETGWDLNQVSPPIKSYIDQLSDKSVRILIAGCGNAYEAEYLLQQGFTNITLVDLAPALVERLKVKFKDTDIKIIQADIFQHEGEYDLIFEQTLFCALNPELREKYARKMESLLAQKGKLVGLLFNCNFEKMGPPFGGDKADYKKLFSEYFHLKTIDDCYNSTTPRAGNELFVIFEK
jgi:hypothetical protein